MVHKKFKICCLIISYQDHILEYSHRSTDNKQRCIIFILSSFMFLVILVSQTICCHLFQDFIYCFGIPASVSGDVQEDHLRQLKVHSTQSSSPSSCTFCTASGHHRDVQQLSGEDNRGSVGGGACVFPLSFLFHRRWRHCVWPIPLALVIGSCVEKGIDRRALIQSCSR